MDISKASNFERFVYDLHDQDAARTAQLYGELERNGRFDLSGTPAFERIEAFGFVSGRSTHADRVLTIRETHRRFGVMVDTHTADGLFVAQRHRDEGVPMVCMETALPAKFADTIREAISQEPPRPAAYAGIESTAQRYTLLPRDVRLLKEHIALHARD